MAGNPPTWGVALALSEMPSTDSIELRSDQYLRLVFFSLGNSQVRLVAGIRIGSGNALRLTVSPQAHPLQSQSYSLCGGDKDTMADHRSRLNSRPYLSPGEATVRNASQSVVTASSPGKWS